MRWDDQTIFVTRNQDTMSMRSQDCVLSRTRSCRDVLLISMSNATRLTRLTWHASGMTRVSSTGSRCKKTFLLCLVVEKLYNPKSIANGAAGSAYMMCMMTASSCYIWQVVVVSQSVTSQVSSDESDSGRRRDDKSRVMMSGHRNTLDVEQTAYDISI